jgi:two-component system NtrC family response regulator
MPEQLGILVVDNEKNLLVAFRDVLEEEGYRVETAEDGEEALKKFQHLTFQIVITDLKMPQMSGMDLLREIKSNSVGTCVMVMTAFGTVETAVEAMRLGAYDYILKPFSPEAAVQAVHRAVEYLSLRLRVSDLENELGRAHVFGDMVGSSDAMQSLFQQIATVAATDSTVLIHGESGTGKELVARSIHQRSRRSERAFIAVNCGAVPETLLDSELFGHVRGAFTGAHRDRAGRFELAHQGTIFLDEVSDMSPLLQAKLMRVLQERTFERVGGNRTVSVDVRIIGATNKDLQAKLTEGTFREDLFYRLNVVSLRIPPLRERRDDISLLANYFVKRYAELAGKNILGVRGDTLKVLESYGWPGNVRELEHVIERATIFEEGNLLSRSSLSEEFSTRVTEEEEGLSLEVNEKRLITQALSLSQGDIKRAAALLQISRTTLYSKVRRYGLKR